jgi:hypothetical protein
MTMGRFAEILKGTSEQTNAELSSDIASLTTLKESQINSLFPTKPEKEKLLKLLEIVNAATDENKKILQLKSNIDEVAGAVLKLVKVLA